MATVYPTQTGVRIVVPGQGIPGPPGAPGAGGDVEDLSTSGAVSTVPTSDGAGNLTMQVPAGSGNVVSPGGETSGRIANFTGSNNIDETATTATQLATAVTHSGIVTGNPHSLDAADVGAEAAGAIATHAALGDVHHAQAHTLESHTAVATTGAQLDAHLASTANPHATDVANLGTGTLAELNTRITDATLDTSSASRPPSGAANGDVTGTFPSSLVVSSVTTTTGPQSLLIGAIADGEFLTRSGTALVGSTPAGSGDFVGPGSAVDTNLVSFDGVTGKLGQDSGISTADVLVRDGSVDMTGQLTVTTGGIAVTAGDIVATAGDLASTVGDLGLSDGVINQSRSTAHTTAVANYATTGTNGSSFAEFTGTGDPNSLVTGNPGDRYNQADGLDSRIWQHRGTGASNSDWVEMGTSIGGGGILGTISTFDSNITASDPASGRFKYNSATPASVTIVRISKTNSFGTDISNLLAAVSDGDLLGAKEEDDSSRSDVFDVDGAPTDQTTHVDFAVLHRFSEANVIRNNRDCSISFLFSSAPDSLNDIGDVTAPSPTTNDHLEWTGSAWVNTTTVPVHIANTANPHATDIANLGTGTLAELNTRITDATLDTSSASRPPSGAASGDVTGTFPSSLVVSSITTTTGPQSLLIGAVADGEFLTRSGTAIIGSTPAGSGDFVGPASSVDNRIVSFDGVTGKLGQDSGVLVTDVSTHIADTANPHGTDVENLGSGTLAELNAAITDATLDTSSASRTPTTHAASHSDGGSDEITVENLATSGIIGQRLTSDGAGGLTMEDPTPFQTTLFPARKLVSPLVADWAVNALAPLSEDPDDAAVHILRFDDTTEQGGGFEIFVPVGATNMILTLVTRPIAGPAGAVVGKFLLYRRDFPDTNPAGAAPSAFSSSIALDDVDYPITTTLYHYDSTTDTLATWGITAGEINQLEITRTATADTVVGDIGLAFITVGFT